MGTVSKNRGMSCVGVRKTGTTLIRVSTVMGTLYMPITIPKHKPIKKVYVEMVREIVESEAKNHEDAE